LLGAQVPSCLAINIKLQGKAGAPTTLGHCVVGGVAMAITQE